MPLRKPHIQMNFDMPVPLKKIKLAGQGLKKAQIWLTAVDPRDSYDRHVLHDLQEKRGHEVEWSIPGDSWAEHINTCKISAEIKNGMDTRLLISFE